MQRRPSFRRADQSVVEKPADHGKQEKRNGTVANSDQTRKLIPPASVRQALPRELWAALLWEIDTNAEGEP